MSWLELPDEDQPAEEIWLDQEAVAMHFEWLSNKYRSKAEGDTVADPSAWGDNEFTKGLKR